MKPNVGDKVKVITKFNGNMLCEIDLITEKSVHFKNSYFGLSINAERIHPINNSWRGAKFEYVSFN